MYTKADGSQIYRVEYANFCSSNQISNSKFELVGAAASSVASCTMSSGPPVPSVQSFGESLVSAMVHSVTFVSTDSTASPAPLGIHVFGVKNEQDVMCDASGGTFTLTFDGAETDSISFDADATEIESALQEISSISDVDVSFPTDVTQACQQSPTDGFKVTFVDASNYKGDVPEMTSNIDNLEVQHCCSQGPPHFL